MTTDPCAPVRALLPAYALAALDDADRRLVEAHLPGCAACQAELTDFRAIEQGLLYAVPARTPPPRVRAGLIAKLAATKPAPTPRRAPRRWVAAAGGLALAVLLAFNLLLANQLRAAQARQAALAQQLAAGQLALDLLAHADTQTHAATGEAASGSLIFNLRANTAVLSAHGLTPLDRQRAYQLWLIPAEGQPVGIGLYAPPASDADAVILPIKPTQPLADYAGFGITIEPAGGSPTPTGPLVLVVDL